VSTDTIAPVRTMPWAKLICARRLPLARRTELLAWLGENALDLPAEAVTVMRDAWAHDSLGGPALDIAWTAFLEARQIEQDADEGRLHWSVVDPELTCSDKWTAAREIAHEDARCALALLAGGSTATTGGRHG
jgi:hypothetical protein